MRLLSLLLGSATALIATPPATAAISTCTTGRWVVAAPDPADTANARLPVRYRTEHFAFRWVGNVLTEADARKAGAHLEYVWRTFIGTLGFPEPDCHSAIKSMANIYIAADYGLSAGPDDLGHMAMYIGPGGTRDPFGLAHEFTHALQGSTGAYRDTPYAGWLWESHANWMTVQLPAFRTNTHCSVLSVDNPHLYFGSSRVRYCNWQFWEYLKDRFGQKIVDDIWARAPKRGALGASTADPVVVLMRNQGWTLARLNDVFGDWALHNAGWDYTNPDGSDQGAVFRASYGGYAPYQRDHPLRTTMLDPIDLTARRFAVPSAWAPQRWGYNMIRLHADPGATRIGVAFRGIVQNHPATPRLPGLKDEPATIPPPASDWRWGLVAIDRAGKSRYSPLQRGATARVDFALRPGDRDLYMVVTGTPDVFQQIRFDQPYYSIYRYPWMAEFTGAMPEGYQPNAPSPVPGGHRHANGGGWVAAGAVVDATAWVGPHARVLSGQVRDQARIEDHAIIQGGIIRDRARISALSIIRGNTVVRDDARVATSFLGIGEFEQGITLSGTATLIGDVEQRGASFAKGVHYGFVDPETVMDPTRGATLTAPVAEVTAVPDYRWH